jgi:maltoporin
MSQTKLKKLPLALALTLSCGLAFADGGDDSNGFHGYMRAGAGGSTGTGPQACYGLGGNTMKYRLGNECDSYFEGGTTWDVAKPGDDGVVFTGTLWAAEFSPNSSFGGTAYGGSTLGLSKAYFEAKNLDFLGGGVLWMGERYYYRPDIHMLDLQFINLNGTGSGVDNVEAGPGKFSYAIFKDNDNVSTMTSGGVYTPTTAAVRQNFIYKGLPVNEGGKLDFIGTYIIGQGINTNNGYNFTLLHNQDAFGGGNTIGVQYGVGPGTGISSNASGANAPCCDRIGVSGTTSADSGVTRTRIFDHLWIQPTDKFGAEFIALMQKDVGDASAKVLFGGVQTAIGSSTWTSLGVRPSYVLRRHLKLVAELGTDNVTDPNGGSAEQLTKLTIAPTITLDNGYWSRPELRFYVTHAVWNDAAKAAVNPNPTGALNPIGGTTSGTSAGVQVEAWW